MKSFLTEESFELPQPLRLVIDGPPGTGKSYVYKAMVFYLFQLGLIDYARAASYTGKAASLMHTPVLSGTTLHYLFCLTVVDNGRRRAQDIQGRTGDMVIKQLSTALFFFLDEYSLIPSKLLATANEQMNTLRRNDASNNMTDESPVGPFANRCVIMFGDISQLSFGSPIYKRAEWEYVRPGFKEKQAYLWELQCQEDMDGV